MLKRCWLLFAQAVTVLLALLFVVTTLKPEWLPHRGGATYPAAAPGAGADTANTASDAAGQSANPAQGPPSLADQLLHGRHQPDSGTSYADAAQKAMPAVVNVYSTKGAPKSKPRDPRMNDPLYRYLYGKHRQERAPSSNLGSGVIVSPEGYILTNQHVIDGADEIEIALADGRKTHAKVIGSDPDTDLAVLKIDLPHLPTISWGDLEHTRVGDVVLAIGNPFAVGETVTMGIVSALGRNHLGITPFENFIQTDAAINPGNSGGALIDTQGNVIGINTAIYSRSGGSLGIGFATPVTTARMVLESIIKTGSVTRGWIGVEPQDLTPQVAHAFHLDQHSGAIVAGLLQNGPADKAGIRPGDIIVGVNDTKVTETVSLLNAVAQILPGTDATMHIIRKGKSIDITVQIGKRPRPLKSASDDE
ncbi:trypsin-like peptidase domain-containing protein [Robbsia sp. KACC 23696]|uniref:S1C family serine protease n=1 Tax=Robbsia sp. KACC 23696 TaxID=3149231 RepID=UPI00325ADCE1